MERSSLLLSAFVLNCSNEPQQLLSPLWGPVACRWSCGWLALIISRVCCASAPAQQQRWARGGGQRQTQIQVGFSMEQHQIWFVPSRVITFLCFSVDWVWLFSFCLFVPFHVSGWSLKPKSKFGKSSPVIMLGQSYELKDPGQALELGIIAFLIKKKRIFFYF